MSKPTGKEKKKDSSPYVFQQEKLKWDLHIKELPWTEKQNQLIELINDKKTRLVFLSGPAGSSKSCVSIYSGLHALNSKKNSHIIYCRPILESADAGSKLGYLPGDLESKVAPYLRVVNEKMDELLPKEEIDKLNKENRIEFTEVNYIRGASLNAVFLIIDEAQGYTLNELVTLITRIGKYSKVIICADPSQSDLPTSKQGGFTKLWNLFEGIDAQEHGIFKFEFTEEDIMRSDLCKFVVGKLKTLKDNQSDTEWRPNLR
jgi:phosphate starvation-inducible protein PhoH and related proteins